MRPPVMTEHIDTQGYGLEKQVGVEVLVPEHQEEQGRVDISHPEVVFAVAPGEKHAGQAEERGQQVYQQHRSVRADGEKSVVKPFHISLSHLQVKRKGVSAPRRQTPSAGGTGPPWHSLPLSARRHPPG